MRLEFAETERNALLFAIGLKYQKVVRFADFEHFVGRRYVLIRQVVDMSQTIDTVNADKRAVRADAFDFARNDNVGLDVFPEYLRFFIAFVFFVLKNDALRRYDLMIEIVYVERA